MSIYIADYTSACCVRVINMYVWI